MVRLAMLGAGFQGQGHLNTIKNSDLIEMVGVCDLNREALAKVEKKFNIAAFSDYSKMLEETKPEGVIICTPSSIRVEPIQEAAERGIHCFVEKPPAKDLETARKMIEIFDRSGVINSVGFMFRYSDAANKCKEFIKGKRVSLVRSAMLDGLALRENWPRWFFDKERSGGPIFDQGIHMLDLSRYLLGEISQISGFQGNLVVPKGGGFSVEDSFALSLKYQNGMMQNHTHSWVYPDYMAQVELFSDELHLTLDLAEGSVNGQISGETVTYKKESHFYLNELETFARAIAENERDMIRSSYRDSVKSLSAAICAVKALEEQTIVAT